MDRAFEVEGLNLSSVRNFLRLPLSKAANPQLLPGRRRVGCPLLQVCVHLDGLNAEHTVTAGYTLYNCVCDRLATLNGVGGDTGVKPQHCYVICPPICNLFIVIKII